MDVNSGDNRRLSAIRFSIDALAVEVHSDRTEASRAAAHRVAVMLDDAIRGAGTARAVFACAPSQGDFLAALVDPSMCGRPVDWTRVTAFHMDEYLGLAAEAPQSFRRYLHEHLLQRVPIGRVHLLAGDHPDPAAACADYAALLRAPIDLICLGIGENGHVAFNDPPADFEDPALVRIVTLDRACRQQQVHDGAFASIGDVPGRALTMTVPVFRRARSLSICAFGPRKASAVQAALCGPITPDCPASILRTHPAAVLYLDLEAARLLPQTTTVQGRS